MRGSELKNMKDKKKCVGIVTIIDKNNYGNRLQNYAVQTIVRKMGYDVWTLLNDPFSNIKKLYFLRYIKHCLGGINKKEKTEREKRFDYFEKYIDYYKKKVTPFWKSSVFDYYIVGSDQVWNPRIARLRDVDLLSFAKPDQRISYAASFGVCEKDIKEDKHVGEELRRFKAISVREEAGKNIVYSLTGRSDVEILIDPTMMLSQNEWSVLANKPDKLQEGKYILLYFLGGISEKNYKEINEFAKKHDCYIINLMDRNGDYYQTGPGEFLYLEKHAYLICTDSFHASVFAIIFNRPFLVYDRENVLGDMNSRIDNLLDLFSLNDHRYQNSISDKILLHDYAYVREVLDVEQKKVYRFLEKAMEE